ncbi:MAG: hypothetical protein IJY15_03820 [Thermoguttaceae bacterium]|nr:hypothetical protein [Thermoguttaceae bacterium]
MNKALFALVALCSLALAAVGCGPRNTFGVVDVTGKITVDGAPVEGIVVTMSPVNPIQADGTSQRAASGLTQADGTFRVVTPGAKMAGVTPGEYALTFQKEIWVDADGNEVDPNAEYDPSQPAPKMFPKDLLPAEYKDASKSEFKVNVVDAKTPIEFDIKSEL